MSRRRLLAAWGASRLLLVVMIALPRVGGGPVLSDLPLYERWAAGILDGGPLPYRDFGWEYPPGAALVITPPRVLGADWYAPAFTLLMVLCDLGVLVALTRLAARGGSARGPWLWVAGVALLGPIAFTRYDTASALLAVLAAAAVASGAAVWAGVAVGAGFVTKVWPALLLAALPAVERRRALLLAAGGTVAVVAAAVLGIGGAAHGGEMLAHHARRGLHVESVVATPVVVADRLGADVAMGFDRDTGSSDVTGAGTHAALRVSSVATAAALALALALAYRARRAPEAWADVAATALLLLVVTAKVLSPQYVVWLLALLGVALCRRGSPLAVPAALVAGCGVLTQAVYPAFYGDLVLRDGVAVVVVLGLRNALLVAAAALAVRAVWRSAGEQAA